MNRNVVLLLLILSPCAFARQAPAADSARIVILSDSVGPVISAAAHERYHVFGQFEHFSEAVVVQLPDSSYAVRVTLGSAGALRDTLVRYSLTTLRMMAEKIDHFAELDRGTYALGTSPGSLRLAPGSVRISPESLPTPPAVGSKSGVSPPAAIFPRPDTLRVFRPLHREPYGFESLPLAHAPGLSMPRYYPSLAVALGARTFRPSLSGLGTAIGAAPVLDISPMIDIVPEFLVTEEVGIQADAGASPGDRCYTAGISLVIYAHPFEDRRWRPFLEGGYVWTSIASASDLGGTIAFEAGGGGVRVGAGIEFQIGAVLYLSADICYDAVGKRSSVFTDWQKADAVAVPVSVDLSSFQFGFRIGIQ